MAETCECLAMIVADSVFREEDTHKVHIAGTFDRVSAPEFPVLHPSMSLYVALTNLRPGNHECKVVFSYLEGDEPKELLRAEGPIAAEDPLKVTELNMAFKGVVFPKPGTLEIALMVDDEPVLRRKLTLAQTGAKEGDPDA